MTSEYTLYGTPFCLYSAKLRTYLEYKQIPYKEILATGKVLKKRVLPTTEVESYSVLLTPEGEYLQDTTVVVDRLERAFPVRPVLPEQGFARFVSLLLELLADEWLVIPAAHYRWSFSANASSLEASLATLASSKLPSFAKRMQARRQASAYRANLPSLGITGLMAPAIEAWYEGDFLPALNRHFEMYDFILGSKPSLADFAFFGPLYAHLYLDPVPGKRMRMDAPYVARWIERLKNARSLSETGGRLHLSKTLAPILVRMMREHVPVMTATVAAVAEYFKMGEREVPQTLGVHSFKMGDCVGERSLMPILQWKLQRVLDCYSESGVAVRKQIDAFLGKIGGHDFRKMSIEHRLTRSNNRLFFSSKKP